MFAYREDARLTTIISIYSKTRIVIFASNNEQVVRYRKWKNGAWFNNICRLCLTRKEI